MHLLENALIVEFVDRTNSRPLLSITFALKNDVPLISLSIACSGKLISTDIDIFPVSDHENGYAENLRDWFKLIYEVIFGDENGPRMGFFISFFGVNETKDLIRDKIK